MYTDNGVLSGQTKYSVCKMPYLTIRVGHVGGSI